jgi:hypothetical protein
VWAPDADGDFTPYATNGYWLYSDYGWTWASNYKWGWAPFHYGRWFYDDSYGWLWVPGHEWAPAWVTWASYGSYYCWGPLAPRVDIRTVSTTRGWAPPGNSWCVVPGKRFTQSNISAYIVKTNATVIRNINIINNVTDNYTVDNRDHRGDRHTNNDPVTYNRGPRVNEVENYTNNRVQTVKVSDNTRPAGQSIANNQLLVYRPVIQPNIQQGAPKPAPHRIGAFRPNEPGKNNQNQQNSRTSNNQDNNQTPDNRTKPALKLETNQNADQKSNNQPQNQQSSRPAPNQSNNPQQQQDLNPRINKAQPQNPDQRSNNPQQQPQNVKPEMNQRSNNPEQPQNQRPEVNQNPTQRPVNQPQAQPARNNFWQMKPQPKPVKKLDTLKRHAPNTQ